jgi:hypothetical protein
MRSLRVLALLLCAIAVSAFGPAPEKTKNHGYAVSGTVARVDAAKKTFVVRNAAGVETTLVRTSATKLNADSLKAGDRVAVRWLERDGKKIATSVHVDAPAVAGATPTVAAPSTR